MTTFELAARQVKAERLAAVLVGHGADADTVAQLPVEGWAMVTRLAGVRAPSMETKAVVVELVRSARKAAEVAA